MILRRGGLFATVLAASVLVLPCVPGWSADWEWTQGAGWTRGMGKEKETPAAQLRYAYDLEKNQKEYLEAARQYFLLIKVYPDSTEAGTALQRLAGCLFAMENYYQSYQALEQVLQSYPNSAKKETLIEIEYKIGLKLKKGASVSLFSEGDEEDAKQESLNAAIEVFKTAYEHDHYGPYADRCLLAMGDCYRDLQKGEEGRDAYTKLIDEFPKSSLVELARIGVKSCDVMLGTATPKQLKETITSVKNSTSTGDLPEDVASEFDSAETRVNELEEKEAEKMFKAAQQYEARGDAKHVKAARFTYDLIVKRYPHTTYAGKAREKLNIVEVPEDKQFEIPKIKWNPFVSRQKSGPDFITPSRDETRVDASAVVAPGSAVDDAPGETFAGVKPLQPERTDVEYRQASSDGSNVTIPVRVKESHPSKIDSTAPKQAPVDFTDAPTAVPTFLGRTPPKAQPAPSAYSTSPSQSEEYPESDTPRPTTAQDPSGSVAGASPVAPRIQQDDEIMEETSASPSNTSTDLVPNPAEASPAKTAVSTSPAASGWTLSEDFE